MFNDLIKKLKREGLEVFAYADDLAIVGYNMRSLKKAIRLCDRWVEENYMNIYRKKSGIILHIFNTVCKS